MIVKIIPETEEEKSKMSTIEHVGVREFMVFGNKKDQDGLLLDFHEWNGQYRYLIGSISFFEEVLHDERRERLMITKAQQGQESAQAVMGQAGQVGAELPPELKVISVDNGEPKVVAKDDEPVVPVDGD